MIKHKCAASINEECIPWPRLTRRAGSLISRARTEYHPQFLSCSSIKKNPQFFQQNFLPGSHMASPSPPPPLCARAQARAVLSQPAPPLSCSPPSLCASHLSLSTGCTTHQSATTKPRTSLYSSWMPSCKSSHGSRQKQQKIRWGSRWVGWFDALWQGACSK